MDRTEARDILMLYRPGRMDAVEPQMAEALELAGRDPELAAWLEQHCAGYDAIRSKLKSVPVPADLKRRIIVENMARERTIKFPAPAWLAAAAAAVIVLAVGGWLMFRTPDENTLPHFRTRMVANVLRYYTMVGQASSDQAQLREYFRSQKLPVDYAVPKAVEKLACLGGSVFPFNNRSVEVLCLYDGVNAAGQTNKVWLFIAGKASVTDPPRAGRPEFAPVSGLTTASWTDGDNVYLLAAPGDVDSVKKYLQ